MKRVCRTAGRLTHHNECDAVSTSRLCHLVSCYVVHAMLAERESEYRVGQSMLLEDGDGFAAIPSEVFIDDS